MNNGVLYGLCARGAQDTWLKSLDEKCFDARNNFLQNTDYQRGYIKLDFHLTIEIRDGFFVSTYTFNKQCDLLHNVDLYLKTSVSNVNELIYKVETHAGDQRIDMIEGDIGTILDTNAELMQSSRKIKRMGNYLVVPLHVAPFHDHNLVSPSLEHDSLSIKVYSKDAVLMDVYAECFFLDAPQSRISVLQDGYNHVSVSHQYHIDSIRNGHNEIKLRFNNPVYCMYFWGLDITKIKRITLYLDKPNNVRYFDGEVAQLEYFKTAKGVVAEPIIMFFSNIAYNTCPTSMINFTRLDNPVIEIETEQEETTPFHLVALTNQGITTSKGKFGLRYVK